MGPETLLKLFLLGFFCSGGKRVVLTKNISPSLYLCFDKEYFSQYVFFIPKSLVTPETAM